MDVERKVNLSEGMPLNSSNAANIFLNTGNNTKLNTRDGTVIHLKTEKPADLGVHINTTLSIASSKKIKLLFMLNFMLSVLCIVLSSSVAFYYWNEMIAMRRQMDVIKDHFMLQTFKDGDSLDKMHQSPLVALTRPREAKGLEVKEPRVVTNVRDEISTTARKYYVEGLGEDMVLLDASKKNPSQTTSPVPDIPILHKGSLVVHFNGAIRETNLGTNAIIGPWVRDVDVSSKNSETKIELNANYVTIKESGLYLVYAQVVYLTRKPSCYYIWARQPQQPPRLVATCASGDDASGRPRDQAQLSCSTSTVARLVTGDTVNLAQREQNRTVWLRPGYSHFGFIKLSS